MIKIICGLGNPGQRYVNTRHNLGFMCIERLLKSRKIVASGSADWFNYHTIASESGEIVVVMPVTFVNRSGLAAVEALEMFDVEPSEFFVIVDDFNIPLGRVRLKHSGSAGGHNGLISTIESLETILFPRLRMGIGPLPENCREESSLIPEFVLGEFSVEDREIVDTMLEIGIGAVIEAIDNGLEPAISKFNNSDANPTPEN